MDVKILDSILHGQLKPWKMPAGNKKRLAELIKEAKATAPTTGAELSSHLNTLLRDYRTLQEVIAAERSTKPFVLQPLCYTPNLPTYKDTVTQYYFLLLTYETIRVYNRLLEVSKAWTEPVDIAYQVEKKTLNNIKVLAIQSAAELTERNFDTVPNEESDVVHFVLYYLKHYLIALYFTVQETFKENLHSVISQEDFYLLELEEPLSSFQPLQFTDPGTLAKTDISGDKKNREKIAFDFLGTTPKLRTMIIELCREIQLLNEEATSVDQLVSVLTSKNITPDAPKIYLDCENTQFRYIVDGIALQFSNLKLSTIEKTGIFFSKNGTPLTSQNLSSGRVQNPKKKEEISNIIKQLK